MADKQAILWSRKNSGLWGCFTPEGTEKLRNGGSPKITKGDSASDGIALDHVLPVKVVPELEARFYNLEAIPSKVNLRKRAKITAREVSLASRLHREGLVSVEGLEAVELLSG